jgi:hypothetical protein
MMKSLKCCKENEASNPTRKGGRKLTVKSAQRSCRAPTSVMRALRVKLRMVWRIGTVHDTVGFQFAPRFRVGDMPLVDLSMSGVGTGNEA